MRINISVENHIDTEGIKTKIMDAVNKSLPNIATEVLKDCNEYAPERYGGLTGKSITDEACKPIIDVNEENHTATIKWRVPYASYVYKGISRKGKPLKYSKWPNTKAQKEWCKKAKTVRLMEWSKMMEKFTKDNYNNGGK